MFGNVSEIIVVILQVVNTNIDSFVEGNICK